MTSISNIVLPCLSSTCSSKDIGLAAGIGLRLCAQYNSNANNSLSNATSSVASSIKPSTVTGAALTSLRTAVIVSVSGAAVTSTSVPSSLAQTASSKVLSAGANAGITVGV